MDSTIVTNYRSLSVGIKVDVPLERLTVVTVGLVFWQLIVIFGGKIGR